MRHEARAGHVRRTHSVTGGARINPREGYKTSLTEDRESKKSYQRLS